MLKNLSISNYAIIDHLDIDFADGFTVITGETGAGKSIILGALSLIMGERADSKTINNTEAKSVIEATFDISDYNLSTVFENNEWDYDGSECIIRREILPNGRSRAFVNDTPANVSSLRELADALIDIHSQNNNTYLANPQFQLQLIDNYACNAESLKSYSTAYNQYVSARNAIDSLKKKIAGAKADEEYTKFQLSQFENINLYPGIEEELEEKSATLSNINEIKSLLWDINVHLDGENHSVISSLKNVESDLSKLQSIMRETKQFSERIAEALIEIKDINDSVSSILSSVNDDPAELERIDSQLAEILKLKKRHNVSTVDELLSIKKNLEEKIESIDNGEWEIAEAEKHLEQARAELTLAANKLSETRKHAAAIFENELLEKAKPLGMPNIKFKVQIDETDFSASGADLICFLVSFNKQQPLMPIGATASGGELSRLMLCVKDIIADKMNLPTIIFDEIDTGVSGDIADKMGRMMSSISRKMQVFAITHLPQVAALGQHHYKVYKHDIGNITTSKMIELSIDDRVNELAGMLGAGNLTEAAINNAKSLLNMI